jgi:hypothetical protein
VGEGHRMYRMLCRIICTDLGMLVSVSHLSHLSILNGSELVQSGLKPVV